MERTGASATAPDPGLEDALNDETFGDGAIEDDWEARHFAEVAGEGNSLPTEALHRDDAILNTIPRVASVSKNSHSPTQLPAPELDSSLAALSLKELWPSSPQQPSKLESIWSSPEIPHPQDHAHQATPTAGGLPPGQRVISVEELEREFTATPPPPSSSSSSPPPTHTPPLPHQSRSPPAPHMMYLPPPMPGGRIPIPLHYPFLNRGGGVWPLRGPLPPPPPHLLPPHMLHRPRYRQEPPQGIYPAAHPVPPRPLLPRPTPQYPALLPHPPPQVPNIPRGSSPRQPRPHDLSPHRERSRRSELLNEMKGDGSGFMTQKEKEWVVKVQLLQLQSSDPEADDYYYLNYIQRKARRESADSASFSLALPQVSREEQKYKGPVKFEQTLGKLSTSSLTAPRKMLDIPSVGVAEGGGAREFTGARKRQILLIIEKLYTHVIALEDLDKRALTLSEGERGVVLERKSEVCAEIFSLLRLKTLQHTGRGEEQIFQQMTNYRKGKRLLKRILPILTDVHAQALLFVLLKNIITILKRDITDQTLPELVPALKGVISTCDLQLTTRCISTLLSLPGGSNMGPVAVVKIASCEFGSCLLLGLVRRGNLLCESPYKTHDLVQDWLTATTALHSSLSPHSQPLSSIPTNTSLLAALASTLH